MSSSTVSSLSKVWPATGMSVSIVIMRFSERTLSQESTSNGIVAPNWSLYDNKQPHVEVNISIKKLFMTYKVLHNLVIVKFKFWSRIRDIIPSAKLVLKVTIIQSLVLLWNARGFFYCSLEVSYGITAEDVHSTQNGVTSVILGQLF